MLLLLFLLDCQLLGDRDCVLPRRSLRAFLVKEPPSTGKNISGHFVKAGWASRSTGILVINGDSQVLRLRQPKVWGSTGVGVLTYRPAYLGFPGRNARLWPPWSGTLRKEGWEDRESQWDADGNWKLNATAAMPCAWTALWGWWVEETKLPVSPSMWPITDAQSVSAG